MKECEVCGGGFEPVSVNHKYCKTECKKEGQKVVIKKYDMSERRYKQRRKPSYRKWRYEYNKEWQRLNPEKMIEYHRRYRENSPEKDKEKMRRYRLCTRSGEKQ